MSKELLTPQQMARILQVSPSTVSRWARDGKIPSQKTTGGHHRFRLYDVMTKFRREAGAASRSKWVTARQEAAPASQRVAA